MRPFRKLSRWIDWAFKDSLLDGRRSTETAQSAKPKAVLTYQERVFFWALLRTIAAEYSVLMKVRVADFIELVEPENQASHNQQIQSMHADFLLCQKNTFEPILIIEVENDHSTSDPLKMEILAAAGIAYLRIPVQKEYDNATLKQQIHEQIAEQPKPTPSHRWYG